MTTDKTQKRIKAKLASLRTKQAKWMADFRALQEECTHPDAGHVDHSDTGNYCKADDRYWTDHHCPDCNKMWTTGQNWDRK